MSATVIRANETTEQRLDRIEAALNEHKADFEERLTNTHLRIDENKRIFDREIERQRASEAEDKRQEGRLDATRLDMALWSLLLIAAGGACQAVSAYLS